jgi:hypothetical protein
MQSNVAQLHRLLARNVNDLPAHQYLDAKRFLNELDDAVRLLRQPGVSNYFNQTWVARGNTVRDLVQYMTARGLTFAPAVSGGETAYQTLHSALPAYDLAARQNRVAEAGESR